VFGYRKPMNRSRASPPRWMQLASGWQCWRRVLIRLKRIYNFRCSMLVYAPFALCFVTLRGVFMRFLELTY
jgi:hypothetical protein